MADYTVPYSFTKPEEGMENSGSAYNGNMDGIALELMKRENLVLSDDVFVKSGDSMVFHSLGV